MNLETSMELQQVMQQRPSQSLVMFASLLQLPSWELEQVMHTELSNNPALELYEADICVQCGSALNNSICYHCLDRNRLEQESYGSDNYTAIDEDLDLFDMIAAPAMFTEDLTELAHTSLPSEDHFIAEFLIDGLTDSGMLNLHIGDVVRTLGVSTERVRGVLKALQAISPAGTFAADARECMLLQVDRLDTTNALHDLVRLIIDLHLEDLAKGRYVEMSKALHTTVDQIIAVREYIRTNIRPYPRLSSEGIRRNQVVDVSYTNPDVIICKDINNPDEFSVEIIESKRFVLRLSPVYRELALELRHKKDTEMDDDQRCHVLEFVARAQQFIGYLRERRSTLERVTLSIVKHQKPYLNNGVRFLSALTRLEIAEELGLHVSTVSRAVTDKYVLLPVQQVEPMRSFFESVRNVHDVILEIVACETSPLTDLGIAQRLQAKGYVVARRTVAKYRKQLGILPSPLR